MLDFNVGVYRIDVRGKKCYWSYYINTLGVLKNAAFKIFNLHILMTRWIDQLSHVVLYHII